MGVLIGLRTFRSRLIIALLILSIPPFAALGIHAISSSRQALRRSVAEGFAGTASKYVAFASSWTTERYDDLRLLPDEWNPSAQHQRHLVPWIVKIRTAKPVYRSLLVADREGNVVFAIQSGSALADVSAEEFFRVAVSGSAYTSEIELSRQTGRPEVKIAVPLPSGLETGGVLAAVVDVSPLQEQLRDLNLGKTGEAVIVNGRGEIVASSAEHQTGKFRNIAHLLSMPEGALCEYRDGERNSTIGIWRALPGLRATLVIEKDSSEAFGVVRKFTYLLALGLCAGLIAISAFGTFLASHVCRPLADLRSAAHRLGTGELSQRALGGGPEEIRELAQTFNRMADSLQRSHENLERQNAELARLMGDLDILHRIDSRLLSTIALDEVLGTTINSAIDVGCSRAAIFMVDRERREVFCSAARDLPLPAGEKIRRRIPESQSINMGHESGRTRGRRWVLLPILTPAGSSSRGCVQGRCRLERQRLPRSHQVNLSSKSSSKILAQLADASASMLSADCLKCEFREVEGVLAAELPRGRDSALISLARQSALAVAHASKFEKAGAEKDQLLAQLFHAQEDERRRVAIDLHDGPTQKVSAAALALETSRELLRDRPQAAWSQIESVESVLRRAVDEMRELVQNLRPTILDDMGLVTAIAQQVREVAIGANVEPRVTVKGDGTRMDAQKSATVFRVAQEALANVRKHANARNLWVEMETVDSTFQLTIRDDGHGFAIREDSNPSPRHFGLMGMRERAEMIGGKLHISSAPGAGTTVTLSVPLDGKDEESR
ncbi:MAG: HAMP domain-containing protein [Armatimonadetes bacterium]|nr:HAMP domain-containing protein [Armatimonadota bacterium]